MKYVFDEFELDSTAFTVRAKHQLAEIEPRSVELISYLIQTWPDYCGAQQLLDALWPDTVVSAWSLSRLVSDSRKAFRQFGYQGPVIQTMHGKGYRLAPELAAKLRSCHNIKNIDADTGTSLLSRRKWGVAGIMFMLAFGVSSLVLFTQHDDSVPVQAEFGRSEPANTVGRVLWVDDHPGNNSSEVAYLKQNNIAVYLATNTEDALVLLSLYQYDAVISDMGRDNDPLAGLKLLQRMRQKQIETAFIVYTMLSEHSKPDVLKAHSAHGSVSKPQELYQLLWPLLFEKDYEEVYLSY